MNPPTDLTHQKANLARELYTGFGEGTEVFAAYCCGRVSFSLRKQVRCSTCPNTPEPTLLRSTAEADAWGSTIPWTPPSPQS